MLLHAVYTTAQYKHYLTGVEYDVVTSRVESDNTRACSENVLYPLTCWETRTEDILENSEEFCWHLRTIREIIV